MKLFLDAECDLEEFILDIPTIDDMTAEAIAARVAVEEIAAPWSGPDGGNAEPPLPLNFSQV